MPAPITLTSPLPPEDLLFESMSCSEGLSVLGEMQLALVSAKPDLKPQDLLGKTVGVTVQLREDAKRHFHGYVTRFSIGARSGRYYGYQASVRPWLWFLTRTTDCRIFQDLSVPDIVKKVFEDHGGASFRFNLFRSYRKWVYCVQYRESDYNFVARLLEHEGIYWYVEHGEGQHRLVLVDSKSVHDAAPGCTSLPYYENAAEAPPDTECISGWQFGSSVETDHTLLRSYDFERPSTPLEVKAATKPPYQVGALEQYDWQGDYVQAPDGTQWAEARLDEQQTRYETARGSANAHGIEAGRLLALERHPRENQNAEYLVTQATVYARNDAYETGGSAGSWQCEFSAIPSGQQFRPQRRTPKPFVQGPQTAVVTGPAGEELFTDKYGRVKVQFHWDRQGRKDENSSCWVRVSHPWAGKNYGAIHIPRIGQEVVVDFLEGDPDQPLVTGRVYNAEQMPPWDLPANATQSGILTRSSKGGAAANANALRFEDKKGGEQVWLHAEKNQDIEVENDETHWVGHDRSKTIDHDETVHVKHDRTETVDHNESITIGVDRTEDVGSNETIGIGANRTETVGANETIGIGGNRSITVSGSETAQVALQRTHLVGVNETIGIGGAQEIGIGAAQIVAIGGLQSVNVGAAQSTMVGGTQSTKVGGSRSVSVASGQTTKVGTNVDETIGGNQTTKIAKSLKVDAGEDGALSIAKNLSFVAGETVVIKTGDASIVLKKDGSVLIKGKEIKLEATKINVKASGDVVVKGGSKVTIN